MRPGMDRKRDLVAAGSVSVVLAQDRDRFAREPAYLFYLHPRAAGFHRKAASHVVEAKDMLVMGHRTNLCERRCELRNFEQVRGPRTKLRNKPKLLAVTFGNPRDVDVYSYWRRNTPA